MSAPGVRRGLELVLLVAAVAVWAGILQQLAGPGQPGPGRTAESGPGSVEARAVYPWTDRPLRRVGFEPPPPAVPVGEAPADVPAPPPPRLLGLAGSGPDRVALLQPSDGGPITAAGPGGQIGPWQVVRIEGHRVEVARAAERVWLQLAVASVPRGP